MAPPARSTLLPIVTTGTVTKAAKEEIMTRLISTTVLLLLVGGTSARADGPWCAFYEVSTYNCGFYSWQQCYDTIRGVGGWCRPNFFQGYGGAGRPTGKKSGNSRY